MGSVTITRDSTSLAESLRLYCISAKDENEKNLFDRYSRVHEKLEPILGVVEKSAYAQAVKNWHEAGLERLEGVSSEEEKTEIYQSQWESLPMFYLNNHGSKHIETVLQREKDLLTTTESIELDAYELFLLLCATELHDVGNVYGREGHEKGIMPIIKKLETELPDSIERTTILTIAMTHGGKIGDSKDTICKLLKERMILGHKVRVQILAAILRFADELADDNSRASKEELDLGIIPKESELFHRYSEALHTVLVERDDKEYFVKLFFEFTSDVAIKTFDFMGRQKYLLDEIYDRTLKMERERRYCMRFMRPYISVEGIRVEIMIQDVENPFVAKPITYTLNECGYPDEPMNGSISRYIGDNQTGECIAYSFMGKEEN